MVAIRTQLLAATTIVLSGVFIGLMYPALKLVADAWYIGCVFHSDGSKTCKWDVEWVPDPCYGPPPPPPPPNTLGAPSATLMHAFFMSLAFGVFTPLGSISFTFFRDMLRLSPAWAKALHGVFKMGAVLLSILGFLQMYYGHGGSCNAKADGAPLGPHFQSMHSWFGMLILALYWLQGPSALVVFTNTRLLKPGTFWRMEFRRYHIFVGAFAALGGLLSIVTGVLDASGKLPAGTAAAPVPKFWWPMATAGAVCMALAFVLALTLFEGRAPVSSVPVAPKAEHALPLLADGSAAPAGGRPISLEEVAKHATEGDCWVVVHGRVYDVTSFLPTHPGGRALLLRYKGGVADEGFDQNHELSVLASSLPAHALMGALEETGPTQPLLAPPPAGSSKPPAPPSDAPAAPEGSEGLRPFLSKRRQRVVLGDVKMLSHDVMRLRLILPPEAPVLGLPVGQHIKLYAPTAALRPPAASGQWNGRDDPEGTAAEVERKYTPTTSDDERGYLDLVIKVYRGGEPARFADGGKMSQHLAALPVGSTLSLSGPWGRHEYLGRGRFRSEGVTLTCSRLGMMAGGTGLTPMLQIISAVLKEPREAAPTMALLLANQTESDILVRETLEGLQAAHPERLHVWYTLDRPPEEWRYSSGFISAEMIAQQLPPPGDETLVLMCGPPPMVKFACQKNLDALGYPAERQICF